MRIYIYTDVSTQAHTHICMHMRAHTRHKHRVGICNAYGYGNISIVIEYLYHDAVLHDIEMGICMSQKIAAHDLTFL